MIGWREFAVTAMVLALSSSARANPTPTESPSPRAVGRAGVGVVSEDSGFALAVNPAGLARRGQPRMILGLRLSDVDTEIDSRRVAGEPRVDEKAGPVVIGAVGYAHGVGERAVFGVAVIETSDYRRDYGRPGFGQQPADVEQFFPGRYGGLSASSSALTVTAGSALRVNDWLALGGALSWSRRKLSTRRAVWAGFSGRDIVGAADKDLSLSLEGTSNGALGGQIGALAAPVDIPLELAASASLVLPHTITGTAALRPTTASGAPPVTGPDVGATLEAPGVITARAGLRVLGPRVTFEAGATATIYSSRQGTNHWSTDGLSVVDESGAEAVIFSVPALLRPRQQFSVGGALDLAAVDGFLWLTTGYAYRSTGVSPARRSPLLVAPAGHRFSVGAEAVWSQFTISIGFAHELSPLETVADTTARPLFNPFDAGTAPATPGRYEQQSTHGALSVELAFD